MGRPINSKFFGVRTNPANQIKVNFHNGSAVVEGTITKQLGSKKFRVRATEDGGSYDRTLVTGKLPAALTGTEMTISVKGDDGETYVVSKIEVRKVTIKKPSSTGSNILDGKSLGWGFVVSNADGRVEIEEAGDNDTKAGTDDTDFTEDA